jgi:hypothetical protein
MAKFLPWLSDSVSPDEHQDIIECLRKVVPEENLLQAVIYLLYHIFTCHTYYMFYHIFTCISTYWFWQLPKIHKLLLAKIQKLVLIHSSATA